MTCPICHVLYIMFCMSCHVMFDKSFMLYPAYYVVFKNANDIAQGTNFFLVKIKVMPQMILRTGHDIQDMK